MSKLNLIGKRFGRLLVVKENGRTNKSSVIWLCECDCGNAANIPTSNLTRANTSSCGCLHKEMLSKRATHRQSRSGGEYYKEYRCWNSIKDRCYNKNNKRYSDWGGRGIVMCDRWLESFDNFIQDMGKSPSYKHGIDRFPNNDGNYEPSNCRWATAAQQNRNYRKNNWLEYNGIKMVLQDWANYWGVRQNSICNMLKYKPFKDVAIFYSKKYNK